MNKSGCPLIGPSSNTPLTPRETNKLILTNLRHLRDRGEISWEKYRKIRTLVNLGLVESMDTELKPESGFTHTIHLESIITL